MGRDEKEIDRLFWGKWLKTGRKMGIICEKTAEILLLYLTYEELTRITPNIFNAAS